MTLLEMENLVKAIEKLAESVENADPMTVREHRIQLPVVWAAIDNVRRRAGFRQRHP